ncbi:MAG: histidine--tRNA ligase [Firmicutes bacterium]|mgnify:CR=1 FL=1|nr:histidine--tRNA ligase [Bacillota bacterium]
MLAKTPRGTSDILPPDSSLWQYIEEQLREIFRLHGYKEIRTPIFEETQLFERGIGEATDIVEKEMYTFEDRAERSLTLRPEGTAPVVRSYLQHKLYGEAQPIKVYYLGPMFRYERPQTGRSRQFHQYGAEALGTKDPAADAEMIAVPVELLRRLGLDDLEVEVNSIGCPECRGEYRTYLIEALSPKIDTLCGDCQRRLSRNPLRVLDCKNEACNQAKTDLKSIHDFLCGECYEHFEQVKAYLNLLDVTYTINPKLVRGFDYYTKTVFEILCHSLGAQAAVAGGGRYDGLIEECGGPSTPAVGFAAGMERLLLTLEERGWKPPIKDGIDVFVAGGLETRDAVVEIVFRLRGLGWQAEMDYNDRSLRAQMRAANRLNATWTLIAGERELAEGKVLVRHMAEGQQEEVPLDEIHNWLKQARLDSQGVKE